MGQGRRIEGIGRVGEPGNVLGMTGPYEGYSRPRGNASRT